MFGRYRAANNSSTIEIMATDVEESDTDDHERPASPKRQCTRLVNGNEGFESLNQRLAEPEEHTTEPEECDYDEMEKLARVKLSIWKECQVAKGSLDNTINRAMETYILNPPLTYIAEDPQFRLFCDTDMEDTAVMMAIRNHGLVHTTDMVSQSQALCANAIFNQCPSDKPPDLVRPCPSNRLPDTADFSSVPLPSSSAIFEPSRSTEIARRVTSTWIEDEKMDESDREQDFLERAVAEAIKKKGLSALSVDYG